MLVALEVRLEYCRHLLRSSGFYEVGVGRAEGVRAFLEYARDKGRVPQLLQHLERLAQEHLGDEPAPDTRERLSLMTIFRAKGLEWPLVFIPDCNAGTLPYSGSENLEEERRLFYVALTRSSQHTFLYALSSLPLSPFLQEAGYPQVLEAVGRVGEALGMKAEELSTAQTLALAQGAHKLGLERFLHSWWNAEQAQPIAAKVLRLFARAERAGWLEALGLTPEARGLWEAFDVEPGEGVVGSLPTSSASCLSPKLLKYRWGKRCGIFSLARGWWSAWTMAWPRWPLPMGCASWPCAMPGWRWWASWHNAFR